ncbi:hypothetical protein PIROE2DRAFT_11024 [Piromyces sp. E2]|nr:hypothetical protein PIROE2DRAFT_11024 [Piromyces sp. E2]|eukprot:OUM62648.1 hypothetical protein PIROE2DRAFT_11024 [Piromyces sp. E2]
MDNNNNNNNNITNDYENDSYNNIYLNENSEPNFTQVSSSNFDTTVSNIKSVSDSDNNSIYSINSAYICNYNNTREW